MSSSVINLQVSLVTETCYSCGIPFAIPDYLRRQCMEKKAEKSFYCPNGHGQYFIGETDAQKLQKQLDAEKRRVEWERSQRQTAEQNLELERKRLKRIERRTKNGVCPCCNRTVSQLARHMKSKHPDFAEKPA